MTIQSDTPMMAQWRTCKERAKDALLLFRLGDFYEAFHQDAHIIAKELSLTLTQRQNIAMCGVPFHAAEQYIDRLIAKGHKVAIAEQTEDPKAGKGLVKREVVQILSPGTLVQSQLLQDKKNNYIASFLQLGKVFGLSYLDVTTGEFRALELENEQELMDALYRLRPSELIVPKKFKTTRPHFFEDLSNAFSFLVNELEDWHFDAKNALEQLLKHFRLQSIDCFGLQGQSAAIAASGSLCIYLKEELSLTLDHISCIQTETLSTNMSLDRATLRHLELTESQNGGTTLFDLLDETATPMGARLLRQWIQTPLFCLSSIQARQEAVTAFLNNPESTTRLAQTLERVRDIERLGAKASAGYATPRDLWTLGHSLSHLPTIRSELLNLSATLLNTPIPDLSSLAHRITSSLQENPPLRVTDGGIFQEGIDPELDRLRQLAHNSKAWIARYQGTLRENTGIKTLKVGFTKAFGYYIEVSRSKGNLVPAEFERRQTLVNTERFITKELKEYEHQILSADQRAKALETTLFQELLTSISQASQPISLCAKIIARTDALCALAVAAKQYRWNLPHLDNSAILDIEKGRHPIIERSIGSSHFIANDTHLDQSRQLLLLTGPNMAGKSTYIRQVALIVILAQIGSYIPAEKAHIGLVDKLFSRIGASDDLARGQSTFMVEMSETANILHNATSQSLVILDEIGRGTSTYDGISIAWSVAEFLLTSDKKKAKTLFATHYWELTRLEEEHPTAANVHVAVEEHQHGILFLRKIVSGSTDRSYGIHVAKLAGLPSSVTLRAEQILKTLENPREEKKPYPKKREQLELFSSPILEELKQLNPNQLTPMQALQILCDLQNKAQSE